MGWKQKIGIILLILGMAVLFVFFGLRIETVHVKGTEIYSEEEIKESVFTRKFSDNEFFFWIYSKVFGINTLPFVEDIEVSYDSRDTVTLQVYDKTISGCIRYMGQYVYFDKDGTVLQSMTEKKEGVPVVSGIRFGTFTIGEPFDVEDDSLFSTIMNLSQLISHYEMDIDRIHIEDTAVLLYSGDITVSLGKKEMYDDEMSALSSVLGDYADENLSGTIDMENYEAGDLIILKPLSDSGKETKK